MPTNAPTMLMSPRLVRTARAAEILGCTTVKVNNLVAEARGYQRRTKTKYDDVDPTLFLVPALAAEGSGRSGHVFDEARVKIFARSALWKGWLAAREAERAAKQPEAA